MTPHATFQAGTPPAGALPYSGGLAAVAGKFLAFTVSDGAYGRDLRPVQQSRSFAAPTRIASAPTAVLGVLNPRGVLVPSVDLCLLLRLDIDPFLSCAEMGLGNNSFH